ncbi:MAG: DinB family protein [Chitinophagaceae bacterium]
MTKKNKTEVWLRGPLQGILPALQPVAHALLQAREELNEAMENFPEALLWQQPAGVAAPGFHLQHMSGVLDRLFTYANGSMLSAVQLEVLAAEGKLAKENQLCMELVESFNDQVTLALLQLQQIPENTLFETRVVGRAQLPSTVIGLVVHAAEHTMRHLGQLLVTVKILRASAHAKGLPHS